jgi:hypothetical protein
MAKIDFSQVSSLEELDALETSLNREEVIISINSFLKHFKIVLVKLFIKNYVQCFRKNVINRLKSCYLIDQKLNFNFEP